MAACEPPGWTNLPERFRGLLARFARDARANFATLTALTLPLAMAAAALAVDEASLYLEKRRLQGAVDMAALAAARDPDNARTIAYEMLRQSGHVPAGVAMDDLVSIETGALTVETGRYTPDPGVPAPERFVVGATPPDAVRVAFAHSGRLHFARQWFAEPTISARAGAHANALAAFSLGSRLASLEGGLANAVLGGLLGSSVSLDVLDHRALLDLDVALLSTLDLLATRLDLTAATYTDVLETEIGLPLLVEALAAGARVGAPGRAVLQALEPNPALSVRLADVLDLGPLGTARPGEREDATLTVQALEVLSLAALLADGGRQVALDLGVALPGVGVRVNLAIGEPMQDTGFVAVGGRGASLETAQVRLAVTLDLRVQGGAGLGLLDVRVPLVIALAPSRATLSDVSCPPSGRVDLAVTPGIVELAIGRPADLALAEGPLVTGPAPLVDVLGLVRVTAHAQAASQQISPRTLGFSQADITAGTIRSVATTTPLESLLVSLLSGLELDVELAGFSLLGPILALGVEDAIASALVPLAPALDRLLVGVLSTLGIAVGEADLRANGIVCRGASLIE